MNLDEKVIKRILQDIQCIGQLNLLKKIKEDFSLSEQEMSEYLNYCEVSSLITNKPFNSKSIGATKEPIGYSYVITTKGKQVLYNN